MTLDAMQALTQIVFFEMKKKDFVVMCIHHVSTIVLIIGSFYYKWLPSHACSCAAKQQLIQTFTTATISLPSPPIYCRFWPQHSRLRGGLIILTAVADICDVFLYNAKVTLYFKNYLIHMTVQLKATNSISFFADGTLQWTYWSLRSPLHHVSLHPI